MYLTDGTVSLRAMEPGDADLLYRWENDTTLWNVADTVSPFSKRAIEMFVAYSGQDQLRLMVDMGTETVGCADIFGISSVNHNGSVGILIYDKERREHGIARRVLSLLEDYACSSLEIVSLKAEVSVDNIPALALFKGAGYREVGTMESWKRVSYGKFVDVKVFQKVLRG